MKQKEGNCISTRGDTLSKTSTGCFDVRAAFFALHSLYLAGVASITCSDWLSMYGMFGPDTLWLCVGITACCSQFGLGKP